MSFLERELRRITDRLSEHSEQDDAWHQLRGAEQALRWAIEPIASTPPYDAISQGGPIAQTGEGSTGSET